MFCCTPGTWVQPLLPHTPSPSPCPCLQVDNGLAAAAATASHPCPCPCPCPCIQVGNGPAMEAVPLVLEPAGRMYCSPVVVLDFQSLYPSLIIAYNLCYSTCLGRPGHAREGEHTAAAVAGCSRQ